MTAYLNRVFVAVCDRCGSEREHEFEGASVIAGPDGGLRAGPIEDRGTHTIVADCELGEALDKRTSEHNDAFADRRPAHYVHARLDVGA
jgi:5-aminopentanamidase